MKRRAPDRPSMLRQFRWRWVAAVALAGYFSFHIVAGDRGALALIDAQGRLAAAEAARDAAATQEAALRKRVALLRPSSLDADMLEEQARRLLNFAADQDYVLQTSERRAATAAR